MANIYGMQLKNRVHFEGREGCGLTASIYLDGKKIGSYRDMGDGGVTDTEFVSAEARKEFMMRLYQYAQHCPETDMFGILDEPGSLEERKKNLAEEYPYLDFDKFTKEQALTFDIDIFTAAFDRLSDAEKMFRSAVKKGYRCIGVTDTQVISYPAAWREERIRESAKEYDAKLYWSLDDFNLTLKEK